MEVSQAEKERPTRQEKALQMGNYGHIGMAQGSCSREGRVVMRLNRRAGARLEGSLHSKLRKLDLLPIGNTNSTEDAIRSWIQKEGSVVGETGWEGSGNEADAHGQSQRQ